MTLPDAEHCSRRRANSGWLRQPEKISGMLTVTAMLAAFAMANSPLRPIYQLVHHTPLAIQLGSWKLEKPLIMWVNEGLMVFFFLLVAMEIKREILSGHLASPTKAALPAFAAIGGMLAPALVYLAITVGDASAARGWAIPTATDTVLALAALNVLGSRVPASVRVFLIALAIFDDLGAIIILALLFTQNLSVPSLLVAAVMLLLLVCINRMGVRNSAAYVIVGAALWGAVLESGVHATLAGFLIGLAIPLRVRGSRSSPLEVAERGLRPWVALGVVPVFAFFNSGLDLRGLIPGALSMTVVSATAVALTLGKPAGILGFAALAVRLRWARLPAGAGWRHISGSAILAGIGFTMSLFFAGLAFGTSDTLALSSKIGVLVGSVISAAAGIAFLTFSPARVAVTQDGKRHDAESRMNAHKPGSKSGPNERREVEP